MGLGGFIFNWKCGCLSSLHLATFALAMYICALGAFAGNFTMPGGFKETGKDKGWGTCVSAIEGHADTACAGTRHLGLATLPNTVKELCEAAKAEDKFTGGNSGNAADDTKDRPGTGKACVYVPEDLTEGQWEGRTGKRRMSPGGALLIAAILFMAIAISLAGWQWRKDQEKKVGVVAAPNIQIRTQ